MDGILFAVSALLLVGQAWACHGEAKGLDLVIYVALGAGAFVLGNTMESMLWLLAASFAIREIALEARIVELGGEV